MRNVRQKTNISRSNNKIKNMTDKEFVDMFSSYPQHKKISETEVYCFFSRRVFTKENYLEDGVHT